MNRIHSDLQGPDIMAAGEAGHLDGLSPPQAVVYADGTVRWIRPAVVSVTARHEFRANSWVATIRLGSWTYDDARLRLRHRSSTNAVPAAEAASSTVNLVDLDVVNYSAGDHWTLVDHSARRVETSTKSTESPSDGLPASAAADRGTRVSSSSKGEDCCMQKQDVFVTFNYGLRLRKKIGPSLLATG